MPNLVKNLVSMCKGCIQGKVDKKTLVGSKSNFKMKQIKLMSTLENKFKIFLSFIMKKRIGAFGL
jgi:hypothetical protein